MIAATIVDFVGVIYFARVYGFVMLGSALSFVMSGPFVGKCL